MKVKTLTCPACAYPIDKQAMQPHQLFTCPACNTTLVLTDLETDDQIICPTCQTVNDNDKHFCTSCGKKLREHCPFCYTENNTDITHCRNCGANLQRAKQRKHAWLDRHREHVAERKAALEQAKIADQQARLQQLLIDLEEPENHPMAIYTLHQIGGEAVDALINHLNDDDPDARFGAAQTLGLIGDPKAIPGLTSALEDDEPAVRYWAADALGKLKAETAIEPLGKLLRDDHKGVREHALEVLQKMGSSQAEAAIKKWGKRAWWKF